MTFFFPPTGVSPTTIIAGRASGYLPEATFAAVGSIRTPLSSLKASPWIFFPSIESIDATAIAPLVNWTVLRASSLSTVMGNFTSGALRDSS